MALMSREVFLERGLGLAGSALVADVLVTTPAARAAGPSAGPPMAAHTSSEALALLKAGNARFVSGTPQCGPQGARVVELAGGQSPFSIVLGCSDSRVPIETIFDQIPGNVFVVRVAGNFLNDDNLGSIEYGVAVLKSKLIVVLGHSNCGAVAAALDFVKDGTSQPGHIQNLVTAIAPAVRGAQGMPGDWLANAVAQNVKLNVAALTARSSIIADAANAGQLATTGGIYDLHTGRVAF